MMRGVLSSGAWKLTGRHSSNPCFIRVSSVAIKKAFTRAFAQLAVQEEQPHGALADQLDPVDDLGHLRLLFHLLGDEPLEERLGGDSRFRPRPS